MNSKRLAVLSFTLCFISCTGNLHNSVEQIPVDRTETMPNQPEPYKMLDWREKTINFDRVVFDFNLTGNYRPFIWFDNAGRNTGNTTFGLYTAIGDVRQGPDRNNGEFHEAINSLGALLSAGLVGIDKTDQQGHNYVKMAQNYFNSDNHWDIIMNNTCAEVAALGGGYGRDWWYDVFPNVLYYAVSDIFPDVAGTDRILHRVAEQFYKADSVLQGNYDYSYFDYAQMEGMRNHIPFQQDAAAGHAYVLYSAYMKFGDKRYLEGAKSAMQALLNQTESRYYEVLMPFGAYVGARLNAEQETEYNLTTILDWTFGGCKAADGRTGWGVISDRWGNFDVSGMQGSITDGGGYGFLMNTFDLAWPLVAMVRYDPRYARAIGKWMLNAANAARLCYPFEIPNQNQCLPEEKALTRNVIAYEGIRKTAINTNSCQGVSPVALGDGPLWAEGQPEVSMFSIYGSAHVGIFGAIIKKTNVDKILQLNCLATDFYHTKAYPTYLYYNPYSTKKAVKYNSNSEKVDLYDVISGKYATKNVGESGAEFTIGPDSACLIIEIPAGSKLTLSNGKLSCSGIVISYFQI